MQALFVSPEANPYFVLFLLVELEIAVRQHA
jgi:hypothetical protein